MKKYLNWPSIQFLIFFALMLAIMALVDRCVGDKAPDDPAIREKLITDPVTEAKSTFTKEVKRKPFKAKPVGVDKNKRIWAGDGFSSVLKNECGKCERVCHVDKNDVGGFTCAGVSVRYNSAMYARVLNRYFQLCHKSGIYTPPGSKDPFGGIKNLCYELRDFYWNAYVSIFKECDYNALMHLSDTAILQGPSGAVKILQRSAGIQVDGIFGKESLKHCQKGVFNVDKFSEERLKYLKTRSTWKYHGAGWTKRVKQMLKRYP